MQIHNLASCLSKCIFFCVVLVLLEVLWLTDSDCLLLSWEDHFSSHQIIILSYSDKSLTTLWAFFSTLASKVFLDIPTSMSCMSCAAKLIVCPWPKSQKHTNGTLDYSFGVEEQPSINRKVYPCSLRVEAWIPNCSWWHFHWCTTEYEWWLLLISGCMMCVWKGECCCEVLWVDRKTRKALYKFRHFTTGTQLPSCFSQIHFLLSVSSHIFRPGTTPPFVSALCASGRGLALVWLWARQVCLRLLLLTCYCPAGWEAERYRAAKGNTFPLI